MDTVSLDEPELAIFTKHRGDTGNGGAVQYTVDKTNREFQNNDLVQPNKTMGWSRSITLTMLLAIVILVGYICTYYYHEYIGGTTGHRDVLHAIEQAKRTSASFPEGHMTLGNIPDVNQFTYDSVDDPNRIRLSPLLSPQKKTKNKKQKTTEYNSQFF